MYETEIFNVVVVRETDRALMVNYDTEDTWLPLSQIEILDLDYRYGDEIQIEIPNWLAIKKGWSESR